MNFFTYTSVSYFFLIVSYTHSVDSSREANVSKTSNHISWVYDTSWTITSECRRGHVRKRNTVFGKDTENLAGRLQCSPSDTALGSLPTPRGLSHADINSKLKCLVVFCTSVAQRHRREKKCGVCKWVSLRKIIVCIGRLSRTLCGEVCTGLFVMEETRVELRLYILVF